MPQERLAVPPGLRELQEPVQQAGPQEEQPGEQPGEQPEAEAEQQRAAFA